MAKLIIDSGGTKMHLALIQDDGSVHEWERPGVNALTATEAQLTAAAGAHRLPVLESVYFYGAGVATEAVAAKVSRAMPPAAKVEVCSDLLGAARALFGDKSGVAVILGTGSNSGFYDGTAITENVRPLGYVLGDEGSGASIGRLLIRHIYRLDLPIRRTFEQETGLTYEKVLEQVYRQQGANRFLASLVPFVKRHWEDYPPFQTMVFKEILRMNEAYICSYSDCSNVGFVGGVAKAFESAINDLFSGAKVIDRPMPELIKYHSAR